MINLKVAFIALAAIMTTTSAFADKLQTDGSISVKGVQEKNYPNTAKITLNDAVEAALENQEGKAISAELDDENGFLVYDVTIASANGQETEVYVDAGNKQILGTKKD